MFAESRPVAVLLNRALSRTTHTFSQRPNRRAVTAAAGEGFKQNRRIADIAGVHPTIEAFSHHTSQRNKERVRPRLRSLRRLCWYSHQAGSLVFRRAMALYPPLAVFSSAIELLPPRPKRRIPSKIHRGTGHARLGTISPIPRPYRPVLSQWSQWPGWEKKNVELRGRNLEA